MIEKIGTSGYETISEPSQEVIEKIGEIKSKTSDGVTCAEVGIGIGATAVEIVRMLDEKDSYYFFSYQEDVDALYQDLKEQDWCKCQLFPVGNTHKTFDSYCWTLGKMAQEKSVHFDLAYLDGAHDFLHDGLACEILKGLTKRGGVLIFDDVFWTYGNSKTSNPRVNKGVAERYTEEQIEAEQVKMVIDVFMDDPNWERIQSPSSQREIYIKK